MRLRVSYESTYIKLSSDIIEKVHVYVRNTDFQPGFVILKQNCFYLIFCDDRHTSVTCTAM